jgi:hypothetical protein
MVSTKPCDGGCFNTNVCGVCQAFMGPPGLAQTTSTRGSKWVTYTQAASELTELTDKPTAS